MPEFKNSPESERAPEKNIEKKTAILKTIITAEQAHDIAFGLKKQILTFSGGNEEAGKRNSELIELMEIFDRIAGTNYGERAKEQ